MQIQLPDQPAGQSALALFALALAVFVAALLFEHIGGFRPCELCLIERKPWYLALPLSLLALVALRFGRNGLGRLLLATMALLFLLNAGLAAYHAGVEWGWWPGPSSCTGAAVLATNPEDLLSWTETNQIVPCDVAQFRLLGLSFAGYNVFMSLAAALVALYGALARRPAATA